MSGLKRIALYGGTFDPVHVGHIAVARELLSLFALDEVLFIPASVAPHKRVTKPASAFHRYAMLALATQQEPRLRVSTIELDAPERPYTVETLARIKDALGHSAQLFFVMGADSWSEITTWREWERVLTLTNQLVMTRPGYELDMRHVTPAVRERIVDVRGVGLEDIARLLGESAGESIYVTDAVWANVSATTIRRAAREGRDSQWRELVQPAVAEYINKYRLYRDKA